MLESSIRRMLRVSTVQSLKLAIRLRNSVDDDDTFIQTCDDLMHVEHEAGSHKIAEKKRLHS